MKKLITAITFLMLWASPVLAQQAIDNAGADNSELEVPPEFRIGGGWYGVSKSGSTRAGEYQFLESSVAGIFDVEWDPLPHRFVFESYFLNREDYFAEMDYSYRDVVVFNGYTRSLFHNLNHYDLGSAAVDANPGDLYGIGNQLRRGFVRFKTPDFPFHLFADVRNVDREGTIQQRFFRADLLKASESRDIHWKSDEYRVGMNSHLGPIEAEYYHTEKKFEPRGQKVLFDTSTGGMIAHNAVADLKSSSDTVKLHTSYSGRLVLSGTYVNGDKSNEDSGAKVKFTNSAGDIMYMPVTSVILTVRYRHFELDASNPETYNIVTGVTPAGVRPSISSTRDVVSGVVRYRATDRLTLRGEYIGDTTDRTRGQLGSTTSSGFPAFWMLPESTTKNTMKANISYRIMNKLTVRTDYSQSSVDNPAYETDPDKTSAGRIALTWIATPRFNTLLSYGAVRESRDNLIAPLAGGSREAERDQAVATATVMVGSRSSITASYGYFKNKVEQALTFQDGVGLLMVDPSVPYTDTAHSGTLTLTVAPAEGYNFVASASRTQSRGNYELSGTVPNTGSISSLSNLKVVDTVYTAGVEMQPARFINADIRYQYRNFDDQIDDVQDGRLNMLLATLSLIW